MSTAGRSSLSRRGELAVSPSPETGQAADDKARRASRSVRRSFQAERGGVIRSRLRRRAREVAGYQADQGGLFAPHPVPAPANVLRLVIEPGLMRDKLRNWAAVVPALLDRAHREAIGGVLDRETAELVRDLRGRPDVARLLTEPDLSPGSAPIVDLHFDMAGTSLRFFSVVSTIGAPIDVTAQELRVEAFFPADDETRDRWTSLEVNERASLA